MENQMFMVTVIGIGQIGVFFSYEDAVRFQMSESFDWLDDRIDWSYLLIEAFFLPN